MKGLGDQETYEFKEALSIFRMKSSKV